MTTNGKTPVTAATTNEGKRNDQNISTVILAHLMDAKKCTRDEAVFLDGTTAPRANTFAPRLLVSDIHEHGLDAPIQLCPACIEENDLRLAEQHAREEAARERREAMSASQARRDRIAREMTAGRCEGEADLPIFLVDAYRKGGDYRPFLEAMKRIDDLDLEKAGLTSWGDGDDE